MSKKYKFGTRAIHAGQAPDPVYGAVMTPVYQTSTYAQQVPGEYVEDYDYSRAGNPTRTALQDNLASLEGGEHGLCFSSGCAAVAACIQLLSSGDHVLMCDDVYGGTFRLFDKVFQRMGVEYSRVDMSDLSATEAAFQSNTKMVFLESPTNPLLKILDLKSLCELSKNKAAISVVDNTFATPYLQRPLEFGADIVLHSTTKYIGGHSDVVGGAIITNDTELHERLKFIQLSVGAVPGIWDSFLNLRSTKTLHVRMKQHCENARAVAEFLEGHSAVEKVIYPGLSSHPQHELAKEQMDDFGGMVTMVINGGLDAAKKFFRGVRVFTLAESLGGVESLLDHPAIMTHASLTPEIRQQLGILDGLIRVSVGIEDKEDLIADLEQALG